MRLATRGIAGISRRLGRPELLAAVNAHARQAQREEVAINAVLASTLRSDGSYVDVGTNRGQLLATAVRLAPHAPHMAFEPIPALAAQVRRSFPTVECRELALGARPEVAQFCHFRKLDGWSGLRRSPEISDERGDPQYITVTVSTLDAEVGELDPRVLKIDVEGGELAVLEGGRGLLARARPVVIFEHVARAGALYEAPSQKLWELLSELDYKLHAVTGAPVTRSEFCDNVSVVNWLATPRSWG